MKIHQAYEMCTFLNVNYTPIKNDHAYQKMFENAHNKRKKQIRFLKNSGFGKVSSTSCLDLSLSVTICMRSTGSIISFPKNCHH